MAKQGALVVARNGVANAQHSSEEGVLTAAARGSSAERCDALVKFGCIDEHDRTGRYFGDGSPAQLELRAWPSARSRQSPRAERSKGRGASVS